MTTTPPAVPPHSRPPGYRGLRRRLVARLRGSRAATRAVQALTPEGAGAQSTPMGIMPGRHLAGDAARTLPIVVIVATGLGNGDAERVARHVEHAQVMTGSFRPLFVIDKADFAPFRHRGFVVERVMRADELAAVNPADSYSEYLFARVRSIARGYGASSVVPLPVDALDVLPHPLFRLIGAAPPTRRSATGLRKVS